jgi:hypothetical protein
LIAGIRGRTGGFLDHRSSRTTNAQLIIDTSGYLAGTVGTHTLHDTVLKLLGSVRQPPVVSPMVIAEIDYTVLDKVGTARELDVIDDLTSGAYEIPIWTLTTCARPGGWSPGTRT